MVTAGRPVDELAMQVLRRDGHLRITARGSSMMPFIRDGDVVVVTTTKSTEVGVGDVVCYEKRSEEHTSELQSRFELVCRLLLEKKNCKFHIKLYENIE